LAVGEVIALECSDNKDDVQGVAARIAPSSTFMWDDMTNYVGQRESSLLVTRPQNETHCAKVFKMFFTDGLLEVIVRETNTYAEQKNMICK
jgi:hypothetical protein